MSESTGSTRSRIQTIALELFTEQGYERTSLREIAERLGVTKAALYYHFSSKDEIVNSFVEDRVEQLDELISWAEDQPVGPDTRRAVIGRYADGFFASERPSVMRFFEQNQTAIKSLAGGQQMRERMLRLADVLARPARSPAAQLRASLAIFAVHGSWFAVRAPDITAEERRRIALELAYELLDQIADGGPAADHPGLATRVDPDNRHSDA